MKTYFDSRSIRTLRSLAIFIVVLTSPGAELVAKARWEIPMPELGDTEDGGKARVGIQLPTDFDMKRRYPAIVQFGGGGGTSDPKQMFDISGGTGFIIIAVPYKKGLVWGSPLSWYMPMLERAFVDVPNINRDVLVTAGFSSGGGATARVTFTKEGMDLFCAAIPAGLDPGPDFEVFKHPRFVGFPILAIIGTDDSTRIADFRRYYAGVGKTAVDLTYIEMPGVGHGWDKSSWPQVRTFLQEKVIDRQRKLAVKEMDAALVAKRPQLALAQARNVHGLCPDDHADAVRAREVTTQVEALASLAYQAMGEAAKPRALSDFSSAWAGTPSGDKAKERYDALADEAPRPAEPDAMAPIAKIDQWVRQCIAFNHKWPDSAAAHAVQTTVDDRLDRELTAILAMEGGFKQRRALTAFIKSFPEQSAGKRAFAEAQRMDEGQKKPAKP